MREGDVDNSIEHDGYSLSRLALSSCDMRMKLPRTTSCSPARRPSRIGVLPRRRFRPRSRAARRNDPARFARKQRLARSPVARRRRKSAEPALPAPTGISASASISGRSVLFADWASSMRICIIRVAGSNCWPRFVILPGNCRAVADLHHGADCPKRNFARSSCRTEASIHILVEIADYKRHGIRFHGAPGRNVLFKNESIGGSDDGHLIFGLVLTIGCRLSRNLQIVFQQIAGAIHFDIGLADVASLRADHLLLRQFHLLHGASLQFEQTSWRGPVLSLRLRRGSGRDAGVRRSRRDTWLAYRALHRRENEPEFVLS